MSNHEQHIPSHPKSDVRNTTGKNKQILQDSVRTTFAVDLEEFCEKHYEKLLPIMADKYEYEKRKKEKLEEVKARLDFGDARKKSTRAQKSAYSESRTVSPRRQRRSRSPRHNPSVFTRLRRERSRSPRHEYKDKEKRESTVFKRLGSRGRSTSAYSDSRQESSKYMENYSESEDSEGGIGSLNYEAKSLMLKMMISPNLGHVKTYNGSEDPEDHLKIFQAAAKTEKWAMPTWCHMFNSTLTGNARVWFDDLPPESIDSYNDLRDAFLKNYIQQKKCIRDPIVLHNIKQRDGESTEDSYKVAHDLYFKGKRRLKTERKKSSASPGGTRRESKAEFKKGGAFRKQHKTEKRPRQVHSSHENSEGNSGLGKRIQNLS
ncbi:reverse transcriptase domain-containing protein [Tanacetum coccineum]|uniref:Reverse transcriptase domain-containing protein n=1 Tax=Tanacetum coccineum TaxID=301880 RepID=A0ABQ4WXR5_9ASTR